MWKVMVTISLVPLLGCASIHEGNFAKPEKAGSDNKNVSASGVLISGEENAALSSKYFGEVDFTFENQTSDWIRIKSVTLDFGDKTINDAVKIPVGNDLIAWANAAQQNKAISDYNTALVLGSIAAVGSVAAATSHNGNIQAAGALAALGGMGGLGVMAVRDERQKVELAKLVPPTHLLADSFVIPPGLHAKKWITFFTAEPKKIPRIKTVIIAYTLENGQSERATLEFRSSGSRWQGMSNQY